ncbi:hypothetical protein Poly24_51750 [Rosistilla carotiformis]|uniref:TIGR03000 domain-containing protein n=1 Tax=Rosistilla carotiformis TaxID=2528017 RepID=A0A518K0W9_9BACT|nr:TIGR03000 domain-containing protein [Rosistilla carotiformis]QDV71439.1 hypothetical protein Poly24_51750 [Rosistilla carotiformis]
MRRIQWMPVALAAVAMTLVGDTAHAGWGSFGSYGSSGSSGSSGSYGSYGSSGGSSGSYGSYSVSYSSYGSSGASYGSSGSSGGSSGHFGILKRIKARHQAWHAARASSGGSSGYVSGYSSSSGSSGYSSRSYASSGGSYGSYRAYSSYGSSGGSSGYSASSGGSSGSYSANYYSAPVESYSTPMYESAPVYSEPMIESSQGESIIETPVEGASYHQTQSTTSSSEALLTMQVPADANVYVNGSKTSSTGEHRQFVSRGLTPGYSYSYDVRIEHTVNGQLVSESKVVRLHGGETRSLVYSAPAVEAPAYVAAPETESDAVETVLTVNVPADAKVTLAGNATDADGTTRTFRTKQLQAGQVWSDYTVSVAIQRNGRTLTEEKTISLSAGSSPELTFDFADETVAMR